MAITLRQLRDAIDAAIEEKGTDELVLEAFLSNSQDPALPSWFHIKGTNAQTLHDPGQTTHMFTLVLEA